MEMKTITVGSRAQAGEMISQIWGEEKYPDNEESMNWSPVRKIRSWLDTGRRAVVNRPSILWGSDAEVEADISRELLKAHGNF